MALDPGERRRRWGLWLCLAVFCVRVMGQVEVRLVAPAWLPPFAAWESGLVPYALLLPIQIALIAWMAVIASDNSRGDGSFWAPRQLVCRTLRVIAIAYATVMALRLGVTIALPPHTILQRGLIPIVAHWDLAVFIYLVSCSPERHVDDGADQLSQLV